MCMYLNIIVGVVERSCDKRSLPLSKIIPLSRVAPISVIRRAEWIFIQVQWSPQNTRRDLHEHLQSDEQVSALNVGILDESIFMI